MYLRTFDYLFFQIGSLYDVSVINLISELHNPDLSAFDVTTSSPIENVMDSMMSMISNLNELSGAVMKKRGTNGSRLFLCLHFGKEGCKAFS